jgi:hypothetical protein
MRRSFLAEGHPKQRGQSSNFVALLVRVGGRFNSHLKDLFAQGGGEDENTRHSSFDNCTFTNGMHGS